MILISMTDFVLEQIEKLKLASRGHIPSARFEYIRVTSLYAKFLKKPLTLGMFVPCDEDGNNLSEPQYEFYQTGQYHLYKHDLDIYQQAKERVLFEGFYYQSNYSEKQQKLYEYVRNNHPHVFSFDQIKRSTVESLLIGYKEEFKLTLTQSAIKQIGL